MSTEQQDGTRMINWMLFWAVSNAGASVLWIGGVINTAAHSTAPGVLLGAAWLSAVVLRGIELIPMREKETEGLQQHYQERTDAT